jgi:hypothetical protein
MEANPRAFVFDNGFLPAPPLCGSTYFVLDHQKIPLASVNGLTRKMKSTSRVNGFAFFLAEAVRHFSYEELRFFLDCALPSYFLVCSGLQEPFS